MLRMWKGVFMSIYCVGGGGGVVWGWCGGGLGGVWGVG